jgi:hypothetical protein
VALMATDDVGHGRGAPPGCRAGRYCALVERFGGAAGAPVTKGVP